MRLKSLLVGVFFIFNLNCIAQMNEVKINSQAKDIIIFSNTAQVTRTAKANIKTGVNKIYIQNISEYIQPQTVQVSSKGPYTIMSVVTEPNYINPQDKPEALSQLEEKVEKLNKEIKKIDMQLQIANSEQEMLKANTSIGGKETGVKTEDLKQAVDFYISRLNSIAARQLDLEENKAKLSKTISQLKAQLTMEEKSLKINSSDIVISVTAASAGTIDLEFTYIVGGATWLPFYDIIAKDGSSTINIAYKAKVIQNTGEDWNNVKLKLSGGNPSLSGTKPILNPWYLSFMNDITPVVASGYNKSQNVHFKSSRSADIYEKPLGKVEQTMAGIEFIINMPYSIPSDNKEYIVDIKNTDLPVSYVYYGIRRAEKEAFLVGKVTNWESLNLLEGETNIFLDGTYTGKSYIDPRLMKDTMELSLGRDNTIMLTRVKDKEFKTRKSIGSSQIDTRIWNLSVHNTKNRNINIILEDLVPVSSDKSIEVHIKNISGAKHDPLTGKLIWDLDLKPGERKNFKIEYDVKYPKNKVIINME